MSLESNFNAYFSITRETRSGDEDGTPTYTDSVVIVPCWFDEMEVRTLEESFRDQTVPFADRRAVIYALPTADVKQADEGSVVMGAALIAGVVTGGISRGKWQVSRVGTAPTPSGIGHLEIQMQGIQESK